MNNCGCKRPAFGPEPHAPVPLHGGGFVPNAIEWLKKKIDKLFGTAVFTVNGHEPEGGNVKIVLDDLADKDGNVETTKNIMVSRDGGESYAAVALFSDLISEIDTHNNDARAHTRLVATIARDYATKTEVDAKADKSALQAEVERAQAAEAQITTRANELDTAKLDKTAVVAPSASATAGQAADAKAVNDALANKVDNGHGVIKYTLTFGTDDNPIQTQVSASSITRKVPSAGGDVIVTIDLPEKNGTFAITSDIEDAVKGKVGSFESVGGASATVENGVAKLSDFFTESNSLLTATIDARLPYPLYAVPSTGVLKDRALNTTSLASVTVPDNFTDLLIRASVASSLSVTMPSAITTKYGDTFPGAAGEYLITITKTGAAEAYVRTIKLEVANA